MKYLTELQNHRILDSYPTTIDKRRVIMWGIDYCKTFNFLYFKFTKMLDNISNTSDSMVFCEDCNRKLPIEDCMDMTTCTMKCPFYPSHTISTNTEYLEEKKIIEHFLLKFENLRQIKPKFKFKHAKRKRDL